MFFTRIVFTAACCVLLHFSFVKTENTNTNGKSKEEANEEGDHHTFVALIDIVFMDGSKRSCTGTIIHDNVVITAAHCFVHPTNEKIKPELTASFVVIGTKKMFETGYEQYLPMERILTHPKFYGWTADLSLIYTFATMTADKPGRVLPLAGENVANPVDSNVTVYSWGHAKDYEEFEPHTTETTLCDESSEEAMITNNYQATVGINSKRSRVQHRVVQVKVPDKEPAKKHLRMQSRFQTKASEVLVPSKKHLHMHSQFQEEVSQVLVETHLRMQSRFQTEARKNVDPPESQKPVNIVRKPRPEHKETKVKKEEVFKREIDVEEQKKLLPPIKPLSRYILSSTEDSTDDTDDEKTEKPKVQNSTPQTSKLRSDNTSQYWNWRRHMGKTQNKLTVEVFGFINMAACKKIVEGTTNYEIKNGEVSCYSSDERYISEEDSGAPAVRHGQLVAVTVGGAQCEGDRVGVGMKMSCYCSWIADNLPGGGAHISCCKTCCDDSNARDSARNMYRHRTKFVIN